MIKRLSVSFIAAALLLSLFLPACSSQQQPQDQAEAIEKVDKLFSKWDKKDSPGCAMAIIKDGKIIYKRGYGMADLERDVPITPKSVFDIASTSKQFVAMCILLLEEEKKLSLDDDIRKHIPEMPDYGDTITVRHMIHHTSGIRDYLVLMSMAGMSYANDYPEAQIIELIARQKALNFKPGDEHLYSNSGYFLLGEIVRRVSGKTLGEFAKEKIFKPLGMKATHFYDDFTRIVKNRAIGYSPKSAGGYVTELYLFDLVGDGGVLTTVEDLFLWDRNFYHNKLGKSGQGLINRMLTPGILNNGKKLDYAFALGIGDYKGLKMVSHGGGWAGYRSQLIRFPGQKFSVICLANLGSINPTRMAREVADIYLEDQFKEKTGKTAPGSPAKPKFIKLPGSALKQKSGAYRALKTGRIWKIKVKEKKLEIKSSSGFVFHASPLSPTEFQSVDAPVDIHITFIPPETSEKQAQMKVKIGSRDPDIYETVSLISPTPDQLEEYTGNYHSDELDVTYKLFVKDKQLAAQLKYMEESISLEPTVKDEFKFPRGMVKFIRDKEGRISGFNVAAGRVKNIGFVKK
jgi:CubicO group peptidase (beta-lactamase class C family)